MMHILIDVEPIDSKYDNITEKIISDPKKKQTCSCTEKTKCLRLHCDCFKNGEFCGEKCECKSCKNIKGFEKIREFVK